MIAPARNLDDLTRVADELLADPEPTPRRCIVLEIKLGADTLDDAIQELEEIARDLMESQHRQGAATTSRLLLHSTRGAPRVGGHIECSEDPTWRRT